MEQNGKSLIVNEAFDQCFLINVIKKKLVTAGKSEVKMSQICIPGLWGMAFIVPAQRQGRNGVLWYARDL